MSASFKSRVYLNLLLCIPNHSVTFFSPKGKLLIRHSATGNLRHPSGALKHLWMNLIASPQRKWLISTRFYLESLRNCSRKLTTSCSTLLGGPFKIWSAVTNGPIKSSPDDVHGGETDFRRSPPPSECHPKTAARLLFDSCLQQQQEHRKDTKTESTRNGNGRWRIITLVRAGKQGTTTIILSPSVPSNGDILRGGEVLWENVRFDLWIGFF